MENKPLFFAYSTNNPEEAIERYFAKRGQHATILLVRPDFRTTTSSPLLVRSRKAAFGVILVSHLIAPNEIFDDSDPYRDFLYRTEEEDAFSDIDYSFPQPKQRGRPAKTGIPICPHCGGRIPNFENLGFWYGWEQGIMPPYWEELREYVFKRDNYICKDCGRKFPPGALNAHHIHAKEDGGEDGARNLRTLCLSCHAANRPLYK